MGFICILSTICATFALFKREPKRPVWAPQYKVSFNFTVPYVSEYQEDGLVYQYEAFQDYENAIQKVIRDGVETVIINVQNDTMYEIFPAQDNYLCWVGAVHGGTGPTRRRTSRKLTMAQATATKTSQHSLHSSVFESANKGKNEDPDDPPPQEYLGFVLPDLREHRWKYAGKTYYSVNPQQRRQEASAAYQSKKSKPDKTISSSSSSSSDIKANVWEWDLTEGDMEMKYVFYTDSKTGHPLVLDMIGINLYTGGHKDHYVAQYFNYEDMSKSSSSSSSGGFSEGTFDPPVDLECVDAEPDAAATTATATNPSTSSSLPGSAASNFSISSQRRYSTLFLAFMKQVFPSVHWGVHPEYDIFIHRHGRRHASKKEYHTRHGYYTSSREFVDNWNSADSVIKDSQNQQQQRQKHRVALNKFADWSREEYRSLLALKRKKENERKEQGEYRHVATVENFTSTPYFLPAQVIWKGTPAESPVKDQAACGSCWAFSSAAALETAVYRTTGHQTLLSEQEMMDCGWEPPGSNTGCMGGDQDSALLWALQRGGVAALEDYPYKGVNDFCATSESNKRVPIDGKLVVVEGGERALQAALLSQGPMAVSVDAESDDFRFYAGGVYSNPDCATAAADLNHAVIVSGYGVDEETGEPIWLVANIWSKFWGEDGYIRITRQPNDCGIATEPLYISTDE